VPKLNLQTPTARARLAPRGKPYKVTLLPGVHLGYRAARSGTGAWVVIAADGKGGQWSDRFAVADDKQAADGVAVLDYEQAALRARALARGDANAAPTARRALAKRSKPTQPICWDAPATPTTPNTYAFICRRICWRSRFRR
jgi:hypothetical protein